MQGRTIEVHDRLDLVQHTEEYTDAKCGSLNVRTGQPDYCCPACPTLRASILASAQDNVSPEK